MTISTQYADTLSESQGALITATDAWARGGQELLEQTQAQTNRVPSFDPALVIDPFFDAAQRMLEANRFAERLLEVNREYVKTLAGTAAQIQDAVRTHADSITDAVRDQVGAVAQTSRETVDQVKQTLQEKAEATEREAREEAKAAEKAARQEERAARKAARDKAAEKYSELTKPELQDELARREIAKTGTVDELRDRLIDHDLESATA
jgi:hypothetical protein